MVYEKIDLYKYFGIKRKKASLGYLTCYAADNTSELGFSRKRPAMLICTGGAYQRLSDREKEPVAIDFLAKGYSAFTLDYSVASHLFPTQLIEAAMAVIYIRENSEKYSVDAMHVGALGFSAGGHLVGLLATMFDDEAVLKTFGERAKLVRPDAVILAYPVVTTNPTYYHQVTIETISNNKKSILNKISLEKKVTQNSVPAFIWHTKEDGAVPVQNSLLLASAYAEHGISFELHVFERGVHGLSLATPETAINDMNKLCNKNVAVWTTLADNWLKSRGFTLKN